MLAGGGSDPPPIGCALSTLKGLSPLPSGALGPASIGLSDPDSRSGVITNRGRLFEVPLSQRQNLPLKALSRRLSLRFRLPTVSVTATSFQFIRLIETAFRQNPARLFDEVPAELGVHRIVDFRQRRAILQFSRTEDSDTGEGSEPVPIGSIEVQIIPQAGSKIAFKSHISHCEHGRVHLPLILIEQSTPIEKQSRNILRLSGAHFRDGSGAVRRLLREMTRTGTLVTPVASSGKAEGTTPKVKAEESDAPSDSETTPSRTEPTRMQPHSERAPSSQSSGNASPTGAPAESEKTIPPNGGQSMDSDDDDSPLDIDPMAGLLNIKTDSSAAQAPKAPPREEKYVPERDLDFPVKITSREEPAS